MSLSSPSLLLDSLLSRFGARDPQRLAVRLAAPTALLLIAGAVYRDYRAWLDFHPGGTPPTPRGYGKMTWLRIRRWVGHGDADARRDLRDGGAILPEAEEKEEKRGLAEEGWLRGKFTLPVRAGERPDMMDRPLPQRQEPQALSESLTKPLFEIIPVIHKQHPDLVSLDLSITEGKSADALFARKTSAPPETEVVKKELAHVHPADNSLHVLLCPVDAEEVAKKGWGERFVMGWVPSGWVMLYAPRDEDELAVVERIVKAAVSFGTGEAVL
ncbi:hypothetical protein JCM6882_002752 [Rhodosporidiobolus microsporus]